MRRLLLVVAVVGLLSAPIRGSATQGSRLPCSQTPQGVTVLDCGLEGFFSEGAKMYPDTTWEIAYQRGGAMGDVQPEVDVMHVTSLSGPPGLRECVITSRGDSPGCRQAAHFPYDPDIALFSSSIMAVWHYAPSGGEGLFESHRVFSSSMWTPESADTSNNGNHYSEASLDPAFGKYFLAIANNPAGTPADLVVQEVKDPTLPNPPWQPPTTVVSCVSSPVPCITPGFNGHAEQRADIADLGQGQMIAVWAGKNGGASGRSVWFATYTASTNTWQLHTKAIAAINGKDLYAPFIVLVNSTDLRVYFTGDGDNNPSQLAYVKSQNLGGSWGRVTLPSVPVGVTGTLGRPVVAVQNGSPICVCTWKDPTTNMFYLATFGV